MIKPGVPAPNLAPLMGSDDVRERGGVRYREIEARSLLNRCDSPRMPFTWTVNPYRGCAMGCRYCYAAYTHEFLGASSRRGSTRGWASPPSCPPSRTTSRASTASSARWRRRACGACS